MCPRKNASHKSLLLTAYLLIIVSLTPCYAMIKLLNYNEGEIYINDKAPEEHTLTNPLSKKKITLTINGKNFNSAYTACFTPKKEGLFIFWKTENKKLLGYFNIEKPNEDIIHLENPKAEVIEVNNDIISMPIFSEDGKKAVIYQHYTPVDTNAIHKNFIYLTQKNNIYKPHLKNSSEKPYDALLLGKVVDKVPRLRPRVYAALSNNGKIVAITGYDNEAYPKQIACGIWEENTSIMENPKIYIKTINQNWLLRLVNITCNEKKINEKFEFWIIPRKINNKKITFGSLKIYAKSWDELINGNLPQITQDPITTIPINLSCIRDLINIIRLQKIESNNKMDTYRLTYTTEYDQVKVQKIFYNKKNKTTSLTYTKPKNYLSSLFLLSFIPLIGFFKKKKKSDKESKNNSPSEKIDRKEMND